MSNPFLNQALAGDIKGTGTPALRIARPQGDGQTCLVDASGIFKTYRKGGREVPVLRGVDLTVRDGEFVAIVGQSGSGKSTLLHLLGTLDAPDQGIIQFEGHRIDILPASERDQLRNHAFGMVFQFYHLLPELTTLENVVLPTMISRGVWGYWRGKRELEARGMELLEAVGLAHRRTHRPRELSGGEMQRTAVARALMNRPRLLLADEPTGNLDTQTGQEIMKMLCSLKEREGLTIVMVTHDSQIARQADRVVRLVEGRVTQL
ncbi:MAG: ABC transporter ATP-binding protein [Planctomycetota bacterium]|nr:ABC transporter ATP-binding protein [Planctomycetota bacterium]MDA1179371.1 ABC transporter ATP-binding protein [Planctomycetota bacterium]